MDWQNHYGQRIITACEVMDCVKSGDRVVLGNAVGEPQELLSALIEKAGKGEKIEITQLISFSNINKIDITDTLNYSTFVMNSRNIKLINAGYGHYIPCAFSEIPRLFMQNIIPVDAAMIKISLPDDEGYSSLGVSVDFAKALIENAKIIIAEVTPNMPRTSGDSLIHVSKIDYFIPNYSPLLEIHRADYGPIEKAIGLNVARLVEDGATIQLGMGPISDAILDALKNKSDLGVHTDIISDGVVDLIESGAVNGRRKTLHPGKIVGSFLVGTRKLYDLANENPVFELYPIDYTNDPYTIGLNEKMVAVSSAFKIDLMGQVFTDTAGYMHYSSAGSQLDFIKGAARSKGGKSVVVLPSTADDGKVSRIVYHLDTGSAISVPREDIHYVVTEYGTANLKGKNLRERAEALIDIAHPNFRDYLRMFV